MKKISELSKRELLSIMYNYLPKTLWDVHPCQCVLCQKLDENLININRKNVQPYNYICDECEEEIKKNEEKTEC